MRTFAFVKQGDNVFLETILNEGNGVKHSTLEQVTDENREQLTTAHPAEWAAFEEAEGAPEPGPIEPIEPVESEAHE